MKKLESGLLLVTGPYKVNGVPLKRVNPAYVIGTSTSVDLKSVTVPAHINDAYFARVEAASGGEEAKFFTGDKKAVVVSDQRKADQSTVDSALLKVVSKQTMLKQYLNAKFSLNNSDKPHEMKF